MTTKFFSALSILIISAFLLSCTKEKVTTAKQTPPVTLADMLACHNLTTWDSSIIHTKLIGKWGWEYIRCYWNPEDGNYDDYKGLSVEFKADNTVEVKTNGTTTQTAVWQMVNLGDSKYGITTNPLVLYTPGRIYFCEERVLFSDTYTDGCDNYFKKED